MEITAWVAERLRKLPDERSKTVSRSRIREAGKICGVSAFTIPLASGQSEAILCTPKTSRADFDNPLIVFMHGLGDDTSAPFLSWQETLAGEGFSSLSLCWDGHGSRAQSALDLGVATRTLPLFIEKLYGPAYSLADWTPRPGPRCILVGHSVGAALALIAATRPDVARAVAGVVAISPAVAIRFAGSRVGDSLAGYHPSIIVRDRIPRIGREGLVTAFEPISSSILGINKDKVRYHVGLDPVLQMKLFSDEVFGRQRVLNSVKTPVLWMHGARDHTVPLKSAAPLMREIPASLFVHTDPLRGHRLMVISEETLAYVVSFLKNFSGVLREYPSADTI